MSIKVYLDTSAAPPVTCDPPTKEKSRGKNRRITWEPASGQKFDFSSLTFANDPPCFGTPTVKKKKITVRDDNTGGSTVGEFPYTVVVASGGKTYSSDPPKSAVRSGKMTTLGNSTSPTIKNN
jgi:hypothetical protein